MVLAVILRAFCCRVGIISTKCQQVLSLRFGLENHLAKANRRSSKRWGCIRRTLVDVYAEFIRLPAQTTPPPNWRHARNCIVSRVALRRWHPGLRGNFASAQTCGGRPALEALSRFMVGNDHYLTDVRNEYKLLTLPLRKLLNPYEDPPRIDPRAQPTSA